MASFDWFNWVVLPLLIFISRLGDVTLATLRHIFISKGLKKIVPFIGFFEVLIWLVAIKQVFNNLNNIACFIAWAAGFSMGTFVGIFIEEKIALGMQLIRIISKADNNALVEQLKKINQGYTIVDGEGSQGAVKLIFLQVKRKNKPEVVALIHQYMPDAFYSIEDVRNSQMGVFTKTIK
ncbi:MAG: DUF2179 domain-containing protein [Bacteroidetes bacterium]|nr:DUF2179 domain-containing protein [Bacteroidota bacterium]